MEGEFKNFIKVWFLATTSLCYCYYISTSIPKGLPRLLSVLPIIYLFLILPFNLTTVHLGGFTAFCLAWLANFKLLLFSFDQGLLSPPPPKLFHFISVACLPIKIMQDTQKELPNARSSSLDKPSYKRVLLTSPNIWLRWQIPLLLKLMFLAVVIRLYEYRQYAPKYVFLTLYCIHIYLELEIALALWATPARVLLGFELEPQSNEPYLSTSLQEFWGRRWNLVVTRILHPSVYDPIRHISTHIVGPKWASLPAVLGAFVVSGLMHELIFYYVTPMYPTWEVTLFFVLHGVCVAIDVGVKKAVTKKTDKWRLPPAFSVPLTMGFVVVTGFWLFFAPMVRDGIVEKHINECLISFQFVKETLGISFV